MKNYDDIDESPLQNRIRDYIVEIQPAIVIETNGIEFLMIVDKEAKLIQKKLRTKSEKIKAQPIDSQQASATKPQIGASGASKPRPLDSAVGQAPAAAGGESVPLEKPFYRFGDLIGKNDMRLDQEYLEEVREYQSAKKTVTAGEKPSGYRQHREPGKADGRRGAHDLEQANFEELYKSLNNPAIEIQSAEEVKRMNQMERRLKEDRDALANEFPQYLAEIERAKKEAVESLLQRTEMFEFMQNMCATMKSTNIRMFEQNEVDAMQQIHELYKFYELFSPKVANLLFAGIKTEKKRSIIEYFDSSHRSSLLRNQPARPKPPSREQSRDRPPLEEDRLASPEQPRVVSEDPPMKRSGDWEDGPTPEVEEEPHEQVESDNFELQDQQTPPDSADEGIRKKKFERKPFIKFNKKQQDVMQPIRVSKKFESVRKSKKQRQQLAEEQPGSTSHSPDSSNRRHSSDLKFDFADSNLEQRSQAPRFQAPKDSKLQTRKKDFEETHASRPPPSIAEKERQETVNYTPQSSAAKQKSALRESLQLMYDRALKEKEPPKPDKQTQRGPGAAPEQPPEKTNQNRPASISRSVKNSALREQERAGSAANKSNRATYGKTALPLKETKKYEEPRSEASEEERGRKQDKKSEDLPPLLKDMDASKYENQIYSSKKRKTYIAIRDFRHKDKNFYSVRQGEVVCCVCVISGWHFVYREDNPKKFGFCPGTHLSIIN